MTTLKQEIKEKMLTEYEEQCLLVEYLEIKKLKFSKIAQETFTRNWGTVIKNKKSGVRKGVPDMMIIIPISEKENKLLFIEMKRKKGGAVSKEQDEWLFALQKCPYVCVAVCRGFEEAKIVVDDLLKLSHK